LDIMDAVIIIKDTVRQVAQLQRVVQLRNRNC
jgi:hypothetical protein